MLCVVPVVSGQLGAEFLGWLGGIVWLRGGLACFRGTAWGLALRLAVRRWWCKYVIDHVFLHRVCFWVVCVCVCLGMVA